MIKVFQVSSDTNIGGAGKCILTFLEHYDRSCFDMSVILPRNSLLRAPIEALDVPVIEADFINERSLSRKGIASVRRILSQNKPDVLHTHASMSARIAARQCKVAGIVYTRHSVFDPSPLLSKGLGKCINGAINNWSSDAIIAVAEAAKKNLTDCGVCADKIQVILNGIRPVLPMSDQEKAEVRAQYQIGEDRKVISLMARIEEVKGHDYLIDAAQIVSKKHPEALFLIVGTGSQEQRLQEKVKQMGLSDVVKFTGFIQDIRGLINITDISANASFGTEATSIALLEGMCLGKPAVVSDFGGNPGVIKQGENGLLFPSRNAGKMAEAISLILEDEVLYQRLSEGALRIFQQTFTAETYTKQIEDVYRRLANKGGVTK